MNRIFIPNGAVEFDHTVKLSNGVVLPKWAFVAVAIEGDRRAVNKTLSGARTAPGRLYMDVVTGALSDRPRDPTWDQNRRFRGARVSDAPEHNYDSFVRTVDIGRVLADWEASEAPPPVIDTDSEINPGFFGSVPAGDRGNAAVTVPSDANLTRTYPLSTNYVLGDFLVAAYKRQDLLEQGGVSRRLVAERLKYLAVNVVERVNEENPNVDALQAAGNLGYSDAPLDFSFHSGLVNPSQSTPVAACRTGEAVRLEFHGDSKVTYLKAIDLATKVDFDELRLDYYTDGATLVTVTSSPTALRRRVNTYYDDQLVHPNKLVRIEKSRSTYEGLSTRPRQTDSTDAGVHFEAEEDYSTLEYLLGDLSLFDSIDQAVQLAKELGFRVNPNLSGSEGKDSAAGTIASMAPAVLQKLAAAIKCPQQQRNSKLFPVASHPSQRHLSDHTQLDDGDTQDVTPMTMRTNNPLGVPVVKGVTDLKTRFGFLGEANGKAVYRDHVGGAAAGMAYLSQQGGGKTLKGAAQGMLGGALGALGKGQGIADDLTSVTSGKTFSNMSRDLFGKTDPTGTLLGCATLDTEDMDQLIHTAASMAKNLMGGGETNPLTYDEWASAFQISKNQPNGHLKKTTTGVDLPAQEQTDPQDTGARTDRQGKETPATTDYEKRGKLEEWNPLSNFKKFSELWGDQGTRWIQDGLLKYEQKESETDKEKIAKKVDTEALTQVAENPSTMTMLDWTPRT